MLFTTLYVCLVLATRFTRLDTISSIDFIDPSTLDPSDLSITTSDATFHPPVLAQAFKISHATRYFEFPVLFSRSMDLMLLKHLAMPSSLLYRALSPAMTDPATGESTVVDTVVCRLLDAGDLLMRELTERPLHSNRAWRVLHHMRSCIDAAPELDHSDIIYFLAGCVVEPVRIINMYGWRRVHQNEVNASALLVTWRAIGLHLGVTDMPLTFDELLVYMEKYESSKIAYSDTGKQLFDATLRVWKKCVPPVWARGLSQLVATVLPVEFRRAVGLANPKVELEMSVRCALALRAWFVQWLTLARSTAAHRTPPHAASNGRFTPLFQLYDIGSDGYDIESLGKLK
ncbi:hypothetical protein BSLG_002113 [Batrachochytrium salamandrivorans]|nr:hypothetical protein BSLG_002113 [Batrachochytrium salamandrivorans]